MLSSTSNEITSVTGALSRSYSYDLAGNTTSNGPATFTYNNRGRMVGSATSTSSTTYIYDALGQRIQKSGVPTGTIVFVYDESGHPLGEYNSAGGLIEETIWMADTPVAVLQPNGTGGVSIFYIHADHLNAPRIITQPSGNTIVWRWDADPFGTALANSNPSGLGTFTYNQRFPGQYADVESGSNHNYFRDFDSVAGKYLESDPVGLQGGVNTYAYVGSSPIVRVDPFGLCASGMHPATEAEVGNILHAAMALGNIYHSHDGPNGIQCNQLVDRAIKNAYPGSLKGEPGVDGIGGMALDGNATFETVGSASIGNILLFKNPGHVVFVTGTNQAGEITSFYGSQSSTGPATVSLPNKYYWSPRLTPANILYIRICLPN